MQIQGSVALVTGANRGIGAAVVDALLGAGARRVYAAMRSPEKAVAREGLVPIALDVTDPAAIAEAARACGDVQLLVNNAGVSFGQPLLAARDPGAAEREMQVNYFGPLAMVRAFAPVLRENGGGAIVNVLSVLGRVNMPRVGSYSASKAAAFSLTQGIRAELAPQGTLVVGVMPGFVDTDMASAVSVPKISAARVAADILDAVRAGTEDVYPGPAVDVATQLMKDPKAVERTFAKMFEAR